MRLIDIFSAIWTVMKREQVVRTQLESAGFADKETLQAFKEYDVEVEFLCQWYYGFRFIINILNSQLRNEMVNFAGLRQNLENAIAQIGVSQTGEIYTKEGIDTHKTKLTTLNNYLAEYLTEVVAPNVDIYNRLKQLQSQLADKRNILIFDKILHGEVM
jgi:hypothetical protein